MGVRQHTQDIRGYPCVSVCVRQHTQDVCDCPSVHISARWSLDSSRWPFPWTVRVILAHVGCLVSTHRTSVGVRSTHMTFVCISQHINDVRSCPCVSVSTHRTSVAVHQYTYQHAGPWTQHAGPSCGLFWLFWPTWAVCSVHTGRPWVSVSTHMTSVGVRQHTQDVLCCPCV